jgi:hypothetical protein
MSDPGLLLICAVAFLAVSLLLGVLAATIRLLTALFPEHDAAGADAAHIAAIHAVVALAKPGYRVTSIKESQ